MHPTRDYQSGQTSEFEFVFVWAHLKPDPVSRDTYFPPDTMSREKELVSCFTLVPGFARLLELLFRVLHNEENVASFSLCLHT